MNFISLDLATKVLGCAVFKKNKLDSYYRIEDKSVDIYDRMIEMVNTVETLIKKDGIKIAVIEEVPVSKNTMNYDVARKLCCLQGIFIKMFRENGVVFTTVVPAEWRKITGLNHSRYTCKKCDVSYEEITNVLRKICVSCGNSTQSSFLSKNLNDRESLKVRAVERVNALYSLGLHYYKTETKTRLSNDNECEAIMLGLAFIQIMANKGE